MQQLVLEKEQALADLNSVEKSLADLFRRYEKMKEVLEGFRKVYLQSQMKSSVGVGKQQRLGEGRKSEDPGSPSRAIVNRTSEEV